MGFIRQLINELIDDYKRARNFKPKPKEELIKVSLPERFIPMVVLLAQFGIKDEEELLKCLESYNKNKHEAS